MRRFLLHEKRTNQENPILDQFRIFYSKLGGNPMWLP